ncbi:NUDIX hydrolase [Virgibacillus flavescens]|uniref:NUDIX hydrolase n=1 Tax=Virgibacillus flavescens TaxID=1611422 RepID=UPI003D334138
MQRISNCILIDQNKILLVKKPRRGWYAIPGGKMEQGETIKESAMREYGEETALRLNDPRLAGVFTFSIYDNEKLVDEWMMFTFMAVAFDGELTEHCNEGILEWVDKTKINETPMAEGDREIFKHVLSGSGILYGSFSYTEDFELLSMRFDTSPL